MEAKGGQMQIDMKCEVCDTKIGTCDTSLDTAEGVLSMQKECGRFICDDCCTAWLYCYECEHNRVQGYGETPDGAF